jgi:hypothetical protein
MLSKHLPPRYRQLQCLRNASVRNPNASGRSSPWRPSRIDEPAERRRPETAGAKLDPWQQGSPRIITLTELRQKQGIQLEILPGPTQVWLLHATPSDSPPRELADWVNRFVPVIAPEADRTLRPCPGDHVIRGWMPRALCGDNQGRPCPCLRL